MRARRPGQSALLLLDVADILAAQRIDYVAIGAIAAAAHGMVRGTTDADALVSITAGELGKLEKVLRRAGLATDLRSGDVDDPIPALLEVTDRQGNRVDLIAGLRGLDPGTFQRGVSIPFMKGNLRVVGREDFIAMKCYAQRPQDLIDAGEVLEAPADRPLDIDLLRRLARRFGRSAADELEKLL